MTDININNMDFVSNVSEIKDVSSLNANRETVKESDQASVKNTNVSLSARLYTKDPVFMESSRNIAPPKTQTAAVAAPPPSSSSAAAEPDFPTDPTGQTQPPYDPSQPGDPDNIYTQILNWTNAFKYNPNGDIYLIGPFIEWSVNTTAAYGDNEYVQDAFSELAGVHCEMTYIGTDGEEHTFDVSLPQMMVFSLAGYWFYEEGGGVDGINNAEANLQALSDYVDPYTDQNEFLADIQKSADNLLEDDVEIPVRMPEPPFGYEGTLLDQFLVYDGGQWSYFWANAVSADGESFNDFQSNLLTEQVDYLCDVYGDNPALLIIMIFYVFGQYMTDLAYQEYGYGNLNNQLNDLAVQQSEIQNQITTNPDGLDGDDMEELVGDLATMKYEVDCNPTMYGDSIVSSVDAQYDGVMNLPAQDFEVDEYQYGDTTYYVYTNPSTGDEMFVPKQYVTTTTVVKTDQNGNIIYDENGNPEYETKNCLTLEGAMYVADKEGVPVDWDTMATDFNEDIYYQGPDGGEYGPGQVPYQQQQNYSNVTTSFGNTSRAIDSQSQVVATQQKLIANMYNTAQSTLDKTSEDYASWSDAIVQNYSRASS